MELCIGSSSSARVLINLSSSRPSQCLIRTASVSLADPLFQLKDRASGSLLRLPFRSRQSYHFHRRCSSPFVVSASSSSSVAVGSEKDGLPSSIEVTEIEQPNSRASLFFVSFLSLLYSKAAFFFFFSLFVFLSPFLFTWFDEVGLYCFSFYWQTL